MADSYRAVLKGDRLEWTDVVPSHLATEQPLGVTILEAQDHLPDRRRRMAEALEKLAAIDAFSGISEPSEWQREIRKDRALPGREV